METQPEKTRDQYIAELNDLTDQKWNLLDQIAALDIARAALFNLLRKDA